jgi:hypothetical protein
MKSSIVLGLGLLTLGTGAALVPALANGQRSPAPAARGHFSAEVRGAHTAQLGGRVSLGPVGQPGEPGASYTITLGADHADGAIVLTRLGAGRIAPGRYAIGESAEVDSAGGFRVLYLAGSATRPAGVFRADAGTLEITTAGPGQVSGRFELSATGFLADRPEDETRAVNIAGAFTGVRYVP